MNNMLPKEVIMADPKDIPGLMHQLPMTQIYDPNINPLHANVIQLDGAKFLYINIDGQSQTMIGPNSPILDHMLRQHNPHYFAVADIRKNIPKHIFGYTRITYKTGNPDYNSIGGIAIFKKNNIKTKVQVIKIDAISDLIWIRINNQMIAVGYSRPNGSSNKLLIKKFFNTLNNDIDNYKNYCGKKTEVFIVGDLNARMGITTGDKIKNSQSAQLLRGLLNKHNLKIANAAYQFGIPTYTKSNGTSIIDVAICNNPKEQLSDFLVDTSAIFRAHRPILMQMQNSAATITEINPVYSLSLIHI